MKMFGFTGGLIAGLLTGMLVAPDRGAEMRRRICDAAGNCKDTVEDWLGKKNHDMDEIKSFLENEAGNLDVKVREKLVKLIEKSHQGLDKVQKFVEK